MNKKISLTFEKDEFVISVNDTVIDSDKDIDKAIESFRQIYKNNNKDNYNQGKSWEEIIQLLNSLGCEGLSINDEYKNISFQAMKFFYSTGKLYYMNSEGMTELIGGFNLFYLVADLISKGIIKEGNEILDFCKKVLKTKTSYGITEEGILVASPAFNYGAAEYNFLSGKMHIGTSIEKASFEEYEAYVLEVLKKK